MTYNVLMETLYPAHSLTHSLTDGDVTVQLPGKILTESGKPADVIINTAVHEKAGLIVLGSRGLGRLKRTFTSTSVSDHVLHRAKCPVVICRATSDTSASGVAMTTSSSNNSL